MRAVNVHEAKTNLSALLAEVEDNGQVVLICRNGKPVAELRAFKRKGKRDLTPDPMLHVEILEDPMAPLDPEDWEASR
jgi:antitoxin (DNA-binding transcriptional repressor) of toxin-antitoxin stability system